MELNFVETDANAAYDAFDEQGQLVLTMKRNPDKNLMWEVFRGKDGVCIDLDQYRFDLFARLNRMHREGRIETAPPYPQ